ncbi:lysosomal thioesterase PPT2-like [Cololabis saira]|uniref:lysosomal thioesterase PPT2-like n=1 Tax=Cololabis saira TaxID=129043 RepID=UPI002AD333F3|nr:lysosomal thioesterase PPT2-like [Cololabis saira]
MRTPRMRRGSAAPLVLMLPLLLLLVATLSDAYKAVYIVHGLFNQPSHLSKLKGFIQAVRPPFIENEKEKSEETHFYASCSVHPGTKVVVMDLFNNMDSLEPMWVQVRGFAKVIVNLMAKFPSGAHLICFSQGGLICRGVLSILPNHNVQNFIALSSPMAGQYGVPGDVEQFIPVDRKRDVEKICYSPVGQELSICNYWKDPHHIDKYLKSNNFLPLLDGEQPHRKMKEWRRNFLRIKKLVLIGGPNDGTITPWQSSFFGFYNKNERIVDMRHQQFYRNDAFGLKTLDARGDIVMCNIAWRKHSDWTNTYPVFMACIERWLT